jgi:hypothetical protein
MDMMENSFAKRKKPEQRPAGGRSEHNALTTESVAGGFGEETGKLLNPELKISEQRFGELPRVARAAALRATTCSCSQNIAVWPD